MGMQGIVSHSKIPLRLASILGFTSAALSLLAALGYLVLKLAFWNTMSFGLAPLLIGMFFFSSVQLFFLGIIGEYVGSTHTRVHQRPLVVERERVNFDVVPRRVGDRRDEPRSRAGDQPAVTRAVRRRRFLPRLPGNTLLMPSRRFLPFAYAAVVAAGYLGVFVLPWHSPLPASPAISDSYMLGFDNRLAMARRARMLCRAGRRSAGGGGAPAARSCSTRPLLATSA